MLWSEIDRLLMWTPRPMRAPFHRMYNVQSGDARKNVPHQHADDVGGDHVARPLQQGPLQVAQLPGAFGLVRQPHRRVESADSATSATANTR